MSVIYIVLPLAFVLAGAALWACIRAIRGGQFDDLQTPPMRMLGDDVPLPPEPSGGVAKEDEPPVS